MTSRLRGRPVLPVLITVTAVAVLAAGVSVTLRADRSRQSAQSLKDIAARVELPAGSTPYVGVAAGCPTAEYVRCGRVYLDVDTAARPAPRPPR